jgi:hypothetical protein
VLKRIQQTFGTVSVISPFCGRFSVAAEVRLTLSYFLSFIEGEIGFFDFYIIPLAKKLKECGVFGVSSDEYLNYAERNRQEWELRGQEVVSELVETFVAKDLSKHFHRSASVRSLGSRQASAKSLLSRCESVRSFSLGMKTDSNKSMSIVNGESVSHRSFSLGSKTESNRSTLLGKCEESARSFSLGGKTDLLPTEESTGSMMSVDTKADSKRSMSLIKSEESVRSMSLGTNDSSSSRLVAKSDSGRLIC